MYIGGYFPITTYTISWTEQSNMSSWWTYSDDAAWLTAWDSAFDEFFGSSAVKLSGGWVESAEVTQSSPWVLDITQLGTLTSWDNVMIKFPVRWIKMSKSWSTVTLSITDWIGREAEGYQYYAFQKTGDIEANASTTVATYPLYIWAYLGYKDSTTLKSWSWKAPQGNSTMWNFITYAGNNWTWWTIYWWYQRQLINAYYMMKYGNPDCQSVIGMGYVSSSSTYANTWWTDGQTAATYWTTSWLVQCKLFWIEDWWGNQNQFVWWVFTDSSKNMYTALHDFTAALTTSDPNYKNAGALYQGVSAGEISWVLATNKWMFWATSATTNSSYNTYYCDYCNVQGSKLCYVWGYRNNKVQAWAFMQAFTDGNTLSSQPFNARLMYI
jgi:hypothetical protein